MRVPPASVIASWPTPNYTDPATRGPSLLIINIVFMTLVTVAVAGRLYSRIFIRRWFGLDDALIIPAFIFDIGLTAVVLLANLRYGWDRHEWDIPYYMIPHAQKVAFAAKLLFTLAATFIRLSLVCFYHRLVKDSGIKWFDRVLHISVAWNIVVGTVFIALTIWLCSPVRAYWIFPPVGQCFSEGKTMLGGGIVNSATDLWTTILPIPIVMRLQMPLRQRIWVCVLLSMGIVVTAAGAVRNYYTWKSLLKSWDEPWWAYFLWIAAAVEIHLAMMCACAPAWKSILHDPLKALASLISSKRTMSSPTPDASNSEKRSMFNPLRSLHWFQMTRFDFERTRQDSNALQQLETKECDSNQSGTTSKPKVPLERAPRCFEPLSNWAKVGDPSCISMRRSVEQSSSHFEESPILPEGWVRESWPNKVGTE